MKKLENSVVLVEGKKDQYALEPYVTVRRKAGSKTRHNTCSEAAVGGGKIVQISAGRLKTAGERLAKEGIQSVIILTDRDSAGEELAMRASDELRGYGITCDLETRKRLMAILRLSFVENFEKKYIEKIQEIDEN